MVAVCTHPEISLLLLAGNKLVNNSRQDEQRGLRRPGEMFEIRLQHTCGCCGEIVEKPYKLRRT
jgi:hypothetical protein